MDTSHRGGMNPQVASKKPTDFGGLFRGLCADMGIHIHPLHAQARSKHQDG